MMNKLQLLNPLLPHQIDAVNKLSKIKVGALFMEQGTGKTITALELIRVRYCAEKINKVIWLCPCSAKQNIKSEIKKHCPDQMLSLFTICGIESLSTSVRTLSYLLTKSKMYKCFLVVDESLLIKNPNAYRTQHIMQIADNCQYRLILNCTPVSRNEADLFAQFYLLDWRILGYKSYWGFSANHLEYDEYGKFHRALHTDYLAEKISPYTFQVKKEDCIKLPPKKYYTYYFDLTEKQISEYDRAADILLDGVNEWKSETIYRLFSGLQAVVSGKKLIFNQNGSHFDAVEMFDNSLDNPRIKEIMELLTNEKTIIFCRYESEITQLCNLLPDAVRFDGKISHKKREKALLKFYKDARYLIANRNCAGYSLNLQFCHRIIYMSNDWDLGSRLQSEDRVHRLGQDHDVEIINICAENTIDEQILKCLNRKEYLLDSIKKDINNTSNLKSELKYFIYGSRYKHEVFDCSALEDGYAESI